RGVRSGVVIRCAVVHDQARAPLASQVSPGPLDENAQLEVGRRKELDVNRSPRQPRKESAEMDFAALQDRKSLPDHRHISLVEVSEWRQRRFSHQAAANEFSSIAAFLHGDLSHAWQRLSVLLQ